MDVAGIRSLLRSPFPATFLSREPIAQTQERFGGARMFPLLIFSQGFYQLLQRCVVASNAEFSGIRTLSGYRLHPLSLHVRTRISNHRDEMTYHASSVGLQRLVRVYQSQFIASCPLNFAIDMSEEMPRPGSNDLPFLATPGLLESSESADE